jgi:hypothetical protein
MKRNPIVRKCLIVGIILLFVGMSIIPSTAQDSQKTSLSTSTEKNQRFDTTPVPLPTSGGWMKTFGETGDDCGYSVLQTPDGGYIVTGYAELDDVWLIKTDGNGNKIWDRTFGGPDFEWGGQSVQQTTDKGYIIVGITNSFGAGGYDVWLIKTNSIGKEIWNKTFGGRDLDCGFSVQQTTDGGYIIAGQTQSFGAGDWDFWLIKTDDNGNKIWDRTFGGADSDEGHSVLQTTDGGYIIVGSTWSFSNGGFVYDVWMIKTDGNGNEIWNKTFGGTGSDEGWCIQQTTDGGYVIAGSSGTLGGNMKFWLIKTNSNGVEIWNKKFGGPDNYLSYFVQQTSDGGYIIIGEKHPTWDINGDVWLVKTDGNGTKEWERTFGGPYWDEGRCVQQTIDGGYIIVGYTCASYGLNGDVWLIKTDEHGSISNPPDIPTITGKTNGAIQTMYDYTIQTIDPDEDDVRYYIDWGDNTTTMTGLNDSGQKIIVSHTWDTKGTYTIKVKAIDEYYAESDWATLTVTMPYSHKKPILPFLDLLFQRFPTTFPLLRQLMGY